MGNVEKSERKIYPIILIISSLILFSYFLYERYFGRINTLLELIPMIAGSIALIIIIVARFLRIKKQLKIEKKIREKTEAENTVLLNAVEQSPVSIVITDTTGKIEYVNEKFTEITGYSKEEAMGNNPRVLKSGLQGNDFYKDMWERLLAGDEWRGEFSNKKKNGELYWEAASISSIKDADGIVSKFIAIKEDITERKKLIEKLKDSEDKFKRITAAAYDAIIMVDENMKITYWNRTAEMLFLFKSEEVLGKEIDEVVNLKVEDISNVKISEIEIKRKDKKVIYVEWSMSSVLQDGKWSSVIVIRDISERKEAEKLIESEKEKYSLVLNKSNDAVFVSKFNSLEDEEVEGIIVEINDAAANALGYTKEELLETKLSKIQDMTTFVVPGNMDYPNVTQKDAAIMMMFFAENNITFETIYITKNKEKIPVEINSYISKKENTGNLYILMIARDISDRKRIEYVTKKAMENADIANKAKSEFLANMSHEIRTPMNSIIGFTNVLLEEEQDKEKREKLEVISKAGKNLINLINDILDFSKIEAGKIEITHEAISIRELLKHIKNLFFISSKEKNIEFRVTISDNVPETILGDEYRINQIVTNLLGNAFKFTAQGKVEVKCNYKDGNIIISVSDTGIGIEKDKQEKIFSAFEQADSSVTKRFSGTGLGLTITKKLIEKMNGEINVFSEVGKGSVFKIRFPAKNIDSESIKEIKAEEKGDFKNIENWFDNIRENDLREIAVIAVNELETSLEKIKIASETDDMEIIKKEIETIGNFARTIGMTFLLDIIENINHDKLEKVEVENVYTNLKKCFEEIPDRYKVIKKQKVQTTLNILIAEDNEVNQKLIKTYMKNESVRCTFVFDGKEALKYLSEEKFDIVILDI